MADDPYGKPDEITGADDPHALERHRKGMQKRRQTERGKGHMARARYCEASGGCQRMGPALRRAGLEQQKHVRPRNKKCSSKCARV